MSTIEVGKVMTIREAANSVKVCHEYFNAGNKEIKYITFSYVPYNAVNDVVACTASGKTEASGELTGPIPSMHKGYITWKSMWFNPTITHAVITKIHIQYMDNTEEIIDGKDVVSMEDQQSEYYNRIGKQEAEQKAERKAEEERKQKEAAKKRAEEQAKAKKRGKIVGIIFGVAVILYIIFAYILPMFMG